MAAPRILLAALLSSTAAVGLAACTPADSGPTVAAASSAAIADGVDLDDDPDDGGGDDAADAPESFLQEAPAPAPTCTAPTLRPGHSVLVVISAEPAELTARTARFSCDDHRYEPAGTPVHYGFAAAGVSATLVDRPHGNPAKPVPLPELVAHLDDCLAEREPAEPYGCYGNAYDVVLDSHGRIMRIGEAGAG
ncbi:hypothetical protein [Kitasatospora sp. NPDC097643]|uniref:hypothetical protein n=1 Tax=Kitasatospora sp. NPDC097643 TaxID=3157230 RepID=UPI003332D8BF